MTSHYHYIRKTKRAQDAESVKSYGPKTWGYDYANDGYRSVVNYRMLRRWIDSQIGRKWDDVWSDANRKWDHRTYVGKTALDYIWVSPHEKWHSGYYIEQGVLKKQPCRIYASRKPKLRIVTIDGMSYYRHDMIWYAVETATIRQNKFGYYAVDDVFLGRLTSTYAWGLGRQLQAIYGKCVYCLAKRQVGKRICKKLNKIFI